MAPQDRENEGREEKWEIRTKEFRFNVRKTLIIKQLTMKLNKLKIKIFV